LCALNSSVQGHRHGRLEKRNLARDEAQGQTGQLTQVIIEQRGEMSKWPMIGKRKAQVAFCKVPLFLARHGR
jgi:hypothetical protein